MTMAMELIRHIAGLYSGKAIKGDFTQVYITGNEIWMAQQVLAEQAEGAQGHGHVTARVDGRKARCGGPTLCKVCQAEQALAALAQPSQKCPVCKDSGIMGHSDLCVACDTNAQPSPKCATCDDNGRIGGPSFYAPDEGGEPCPDCSQPSPAPELERPELAGWRDRILKAHPGSDPRYWPDALLVQHMTAEIADLRAAQARPSVDLEHIGSLISVFRNATRDDAENGGREYFEKARSAEQELRQEIDRIVGALRADAERWKEQFACMQLQRDHHRDRADAAQARVAELEQSQGAEVFLTLTSEITQLKAKLAELEKQKEFGHVFVSIKEGHKCFEFDEYSHAYSFPVGEHQLYAAPVAQAGQAPEKPTEAMLQAGMNAMAEAQRNGSQSLYAYAGVCWDAMLAASPQPAGGE